MKITITKGTGTGSTLLSAFDAALQACGVSNYNILFLSSIIPPNSQIVQEKYKTPKSQFGDRLYVVRAEKRSAVVNQWIGAAIGWYHPEKDGGLFVEHDTSGKTKEEVEKKLRSDVFNSLKDLCRFRNFACTDKDIQIDMNVTQVKDVPTCVLVLAVYQSEPWK